MKNASKEKLKSSTTIEDDISGNNNNTKEKRKFEDFFEELEIIGEVGFF